MTMPKMPSLKTAIKKDDSLNAPRIRFNWGFHDAACETRLHIRRSLVDGKTQTVRTVAIGFDKWYYYGYSAGMLAVDTGVYANNSDPAWSEFIAQLA